MIQYYYNVLLSNKFDQPNFTDLFRIAESILNKDERAHKDLLKRLDDLNISLNGIPISIAELELVFYKNATKGINSEIEINGETYTLGKLFFMINEVIKEITKMISNVAYDYDIDMPMRSTREGGIEW